MIKERTDAWFRNRDKLKKYFETHTQEQYGQNYRYKKEDNQKSLSMIRRIRMNTGSLRGPDGLLPGRLYLVDP